MQFSRKVYDKTKFYSLAFNKIYEKISRDTEFLQEKLKKVGEKDALTGKLLEIHKKDSEYAQRQVLF